MRYRQALMEGHRELSQHPLNTRSTEAICSRIMGTSMGLRGVPGTAPANVTTGDIIYTPPDGQVLICELLANWERYLNESNGVDPLIRMAVAHYQFEAIHPFTDGNGRTGRLLNSLFLVQAGLLTLPILYLSRHIIHHKSDYYRLLLGVTSEGAWEAWVLYLLEAVEHTSLWTLEKIAAIRSLASATLDYVRVQLPKIYSRELIDVLFMQPYCRIANLVAVNIAQRQAASRYLQALAEIGVLERRRIGREALYVNIRLLRLLTSDHNDYAPFR